MSMSKTHREKLFEFRDKYFLSSSATDELIDIVAEAYAKGRIDASIDLITQINKKSYE